MANHCQYCSKKIPISKVFCSKECKENYFEKAIINIPKPFVKKLYFFCNEKEKEAEILKFCERHNWKEHLVKQKIEEIYLEYFKCG